MNLRPFLLFASLAIAAALTFIARQRTLTRIRADNEILHQQLEAPAILVEMNTAVKTQATNVVEELSDEERRELLRLRGQFQPLKSELQAALSRAADTAGTNRNRQRHASEGTNGDSQLPENLRAHMQIMEAYRQSPAYLDADRFASAFRNYLAQNGGQLPDDLAKVEQADTGLPPGVSQRFELMQSEPIPNEARTYTLYAREKEAQQQPDGWMSRIYFFADGTMTTVGMNTPSPNWTGSERNMETRAKARTLHPDTVPH